MLMKKILVFSVTYFPKFVGGAEIAVKEITDRLNPEEYEFHLITLRLDKNLAKEEKIGNVHVYRVGFAGKVKEYQDTLTFPLHYNKYLFPFMAAWKGGQLLNQHKFSWIWSIMANYSGFGALFFKWLHSDIPFLLTLQEGDPLDYIKRRVSIMRPIFRRIFRKADYIQAISHYLADFGFSMGFRGKMRIIPNGVNLERFSGEISEERKIKLREEVGVNKGEIALITTSRLVVKNGIGDVIKALPKLPSKVKFIIFGEGYLRAKLEALVKSLNLDDRVRFEGFISHREMPKYLKASDIFIRPSLSEGFGNSFVEAMAAKLLVIAPPVGGIVDFLVDNETGYLCQPEDPDSIVKAVEKAINSDNSRIIQNAYEMVCERYGWKVITEEIKEIFDDEDY
jgi:glycosyltransferase involved in cell wall biosynthesis